MTTEATLPYPSTSEKVDLRTKWRDLVGPRLLCLTTKPHSPAIPELRRLLKVKEQSSGVHVDLHFLVGEAKEIALPDRPGSPIPEETISWIRAGDLFEKVLTYLARTERPDTVLFLDPWAALILARGLNLAPGSKCLFLSDLKERAIRENSEYWTATDRWIKDLPIVEILRGQEIGLRSEDPDQSVPESRSQEEQLRHSPIGDVSPGTLPAWRWKEIVPRVREASPSSSPSPAFALFHRGSLLHLRVAVHALASQESLGEGSQVSILARNPGIELKRLIRILGVAHPRLTLTILSMPGREDDWAETGRNLATNIPSPAVLLLDDSTLLPRDFSKKLITLFSAKKGVTPFGRLVLDAKRAAQVLSGTLDSTSHYEDLLQDSSVPDPTQRPAAVALNGDEATHPDSIGERLRTFAWGATSELLEEPLQAGGLLSLPEYV